MYSPARLILLSGIVLLTACGTAKRVAVTSFRVIDAPARFVRDRIDPENETTTSTVTQSTVTSDVVNPGHPIVAATPRPQATQQRSTAQGRATSTPRRTTAANESTSRSTQTEPAGTPRSNRSATAGQGTPPPSAGFPTARPVPGKPGYVYSIDPTGGIVDVTGYKAGDKAKDPYTKQIFIVP